MIWLIAWAATAVIFGVLDGLWLRFAGPAAYRPLLGDLLAPRVNKPAALLFYVIYVSGMVWFAVQLGFFLGIQHAVLNGALLGLFAYATYALTNRATIRDWPWRLVLLDIAWGTAATSLACGLAAYTMRAAALQLAT